MNKAELIPYTVGVKCTPDATDYQMKHMTLSQNEVDLWGNAIITCDEGYAFHVSTTPPEVVSNVSVRCVYKSADQSAKLEPYDDTYSHLECQGKIILYQRYIELHHHFHFLLECCVLLLATYNIVILGQYQDRQKTKMYENDKKCGERIRAWSVIKPDFQDGHLRIRYILRYYRRMTVWYQ